ncbi:MAG: PBP1A family penicillin-binding protein, partial [Evtepia sp.]
MSDQYERKDFEQRDRNSSESPSRSSIPPDGNPNRMPPYRPPMPSDGKRTHTSWDTLPHGGMSSGDGERMSPGNGRRISPSDRRMPPSGGGRMPPSGGGRMPPSGSGRMPPSGGGRMPPSGGGRMPPSGGGRMPPSGGGRMPPDDGDGSRQRSAGHSAGQVIGTIFLIFFITGVMLLCLFAVYVKTVIMPQADLQLTDFSLNLTTTVFYDDPKSENPVELETLHESENRIWVAYDEIPQDLVKAAIAIEDRRFEKHNGVDWIRTAKGVINMFTGQDIQGGSTITQQLIKNLTNEDQVTVKRKITEIFRALSFEKKYSKQEILEWYLNCIFLGEGCNGVYTASYAYFGKHVSELTLAECASLIGITNNPSLYNPYLNRDKNKERQELILRSMCEQNVISEAERDAAIAEELQFVAGEDETKTAPIYKWYTDAVISDVVDDLQTNLNLSRDAATNMVYSGGLSIYSCFDPTVQAAVDEVYTDRNNLNYTSKSGQPMQSAITVVDNNTGNVVAMAGGVGEKTKSRAWNRATHTLRPPGSSIKPLAVYAPAMEMGYITPLSTEVDSPYKGSWPVNAYGSYRGKMTMMTALEDSANTVAVKVLAKYVTPQKSFEFMRDKFGIKLVESRTVGKKVYSDIDLAPLALGGLTDGVSTFDMAAAFATFARNGMYDHPRTYTTVLDSKGEVLLDNTQKSDSILKESTVCYMNQMLENVVNAGTGTAAKFSGMTIAGKTGTTSARKDLWFVGYTPYYTAAIWTGYDQQEKLSSSIGNPSAMLWKQVMQKVHKDLPNK